MQSASWPPIPTVVCVFHSVRRRFFTFLLFLFLLHTLGMAMFRFVAALSRNETVMAVAGSAFFLLLILLGGFLLSAGALLPALPWCRSRITGSHCMPCSWKIICSL